MERFLFCCSRLKGKHMITNNVLQNGEVARPYTPEQLPVDDTYFLVAGGAGDVALGQQVSVEHLVGPDLSTLPLDDTTATRARASL